MPAKTMVGARAVVYIENVAVGIFESVSYNKSYGTEPVHGLGRYSPSEIVVTSSEAVTLSCGAFRVVGQGATVLPKMPKVQDLLNLEAVTIVVVDRQTNKAIFTALGCIPNSESGAHNARAASRVTIGYTGTIASDESGAQGESAGATNLP